MRITRPARIARLAFAAGAAFLAGAGIAGAQDRGAGGDVERGRQLYYEHGCYGCHGFNGETGARDLVATGSPIIADAGTFVAFLRLRGDFAPVLPTTRMPNYPETALSDAQARDIFAFVQTFDLDAPAVEDIPVFEQILDAAARPYEP